MERKGAEKTIKEFGFVGREYDAGSHKDDGIVYEFPRSGGEGSIIINGADLFVDNWEYLKMEVDNYGIVVRLYHEYTYIGCMVYSWDDVECFKIRKGY